jgi:8-oxo-dGTP pyrophosphatase MutT (NUDIX family)
VSLARALLARLEVHAPHDADERRAVETMRAFVAATPEPFTRRTHAGHVTGSAVVLEPSGRALLLFHARLSLWVQPGGHVEDGESPDRAALREATEESGLDDLVLDAGPDGAPRLLDVDVHPIPASEKRGEPAHFHHDVCFLARTRRPEATRHDPDESRAFRWVDAAQAAALPLDTATRRRLAKAFADR